MANFLKNWKSNPEEYPAEIVMKTVIFATASFNLKYRLLPVYVYTSRVLKGTKYRNPQVPFICQESHDL